MRRTFLALAFGATFAFTTNAQTTALNENFQAGIPIGWTLVTNDNNTPAMAVQEYDSAAWISKMDPEDSLNLTASSTSYFDPAGTANRWMITEAISLGNYGNSLTYDIKSHDPSFPDSYMIMASRTGTNLADFTDTIARVNFELATWTTRTVDLTAKGLDGETIHLAFIITTDDGFKLYLDNVKLTIDDPASLTELEVTDIELATLENGLYYLNSDAALISTEVYNTEGLKIMETVSNTIDLRAAAPGVYILKAQTNRGLQTLKLQRF